MGRRAGGRIQNQGIKTEQQKAQKDLICAYGHVQRKLAEERSTGTLCFGINKIKTRSALEAQHVLI